MKKKKSFKFDEVQVSSITLDAPRIYVPATQWGKKRVKERDPETDITVPILRAILKFNNYASDLDVERE